ncbi:MAG: Hsp20/alpha crystallin family protein [Deltaproteobacteria bacterium]|nr:Hsp20/alpha crystallin family protein [Deltaproteobacteria bacterium]MBW1961369.1 Hsp20/alpha crystallin family protein [Deltaproteobacteria bacterium]MBW1993308.1 Hsp20/alpha crystallin family protein [Deltaproteobacteria bacterium]MBW2152529.1 Hsp20/alpha crystallin family protein [Deltaproteobacteria bacterium]
MATAESKELQVKRKSELTTAAEQTTAGPVFTPAVDIFETEKQITLLADLPGVKADDLKIDLRDNTLTLSAEVQPYEGTNEEDILVEYEVGKYYRQFTLSEAIDQDKIEAELKDGVLRLILPKAEEAIPKKITIKTE